MISTDKMLVNVVVAIIFIIAAVVVFCEVRERWGKHIWVIPVCQEMIEGEK